MTLTMGQCVKQYKRHKDKEKEAKHNKEAGEEEREKPRSHPGGASTTR